MTLNLLLQQLINAMELGSIYAMIAVGLALVYGVLRILHVAQAGVYAAGAFIGLFLYQEIGSFPVSLVGAMLLAGALGMLIERFVYRSFALDFTARYTMIFQAQKVNQGIQALAGMIFYVAY